METIDANGRRHIIEHDREVGTETTMVRIGGIVVLVAEDERHTFTLRLFMRPNPAADKDHEARTCRVGEYLLGYRGCG